MSKITRKKKAFEYVDKKTQITNNRKEVRLKSEL